MKTKKFNGRIGKVVSLPDESSNKEDDNSQRYTIKLYERYKKLGIKPENLKLFEGNFKLGERILTVDLSTKELNQCTGVIVNLPEVDTNSADDRFGVKIEKVMDTKLIKRKNLIWNRKTKKQFDEELYPKQNLVEYVSNWRELLQSAAQNGYKRPTYEMPNLLEELMAHSGLPNGVDKKWAEGYLNFVFHISWIAKVEYETKYKKHDFKPGIEELSQRLPTFTQKDGSLQWYFGPRRVGDVDAARPTLQYSSMFSHSFSNQYYHTANMPIAPVVAVGFADLGLLLTVNLRTLEGSNEDVLKFYGIDQGAFVVAKTLVIWEMIRSKKQENYNEQLHFILQAWFSTTFSKGCHEVVMNAVYKALENVNEKTNEDVLKILNYWKDLGDKKIPVSVAREEKVRSTQPGYSKLYNFARLQDRLEVMNYELTGDFCLLGDEVEANFMRHHLPLGTPPMLKNETVLSTVDSQTLMEVLLKNKSLTVLQAIKQYLLKHLEKLVQRARAGKIQIKLYCSRIETMKSRIAALKPRTMTWSNILDYMDYTSFHEMARACSVNGHCVHYAYSMNWTQKTFGSRIDDFYREGSGLRAKIIDSVVEGLTKQYNSNGWNQIVAMPVRETKMVVEKYNLERQTFQPWATSFCEVGKQSGRITMNPADFSGYMPFSATGGGSVYVSWTYTI